SGRRGSRISSRCCGIILATTSTRCCRCSRWRWWGPRRLRCCPGTADRMKHFIYKNLNELRRGAEEVGARHVRFEEDPGEIRRQVARTVDVDGFRVGNALAIHPMEGCDGTPDGRPDEL